MSFNIGEIEGQLDSSRSVCASWSIRGADPDLVGVRNGGEATSQNTDDGHPGETTSIFNSISAIHMVDAAA